MHSLPGSKAKSASLPLPSEQNSSAWYPGIRARGWDFFPAAENQVHVGQRQVAPEEHVPYQACEQPLWGGGRKCNLGARAAVGRGQNRLENRSTRTSWNLAGFRWCTRTRSQGGRGVGCPWWLCQLCSGGLQHCGGTDPSTSDLGSRTFSHLQTKSSCQIPPNSVWNAHIYAHFTGPVNWLAFPDQKGHNSNFSPRLWLFKIFQMKIMNC